MHKAMRIGIVSIPLLLAAALAWRAQSDPHLDLGERNPPAGPSEPGVLRVMTLNIAHGRRLAKNQVYLPRKRFASNLKGIGDVVSLEAPDVVALQEADGPSVWSGHFDHVESLAKYVDYPWAYRGFHASVDWPTPIVYGTALLGLHPLKEPQSIAFDENWRDSKGFVVATVDDPDLGEIDVVSVHLDFLRSDVRNRQVETLVDKLEGRGRPLIVLGDLNCDSDAQAWKHLQEGLELHGHEGEFQPTYPAESPRTRIDWILLSSELTFDSYRVLDDVVSDHRGIVAEISRVTDPQA